MNKIEDLSDSFLVFPNKNNSKETISYCQSKTNSFHDSTYLWCKKCNLILCYNCSMNHLLNNQIDHSFNNTFLSKEVLDMEYYKDFSKIETLKKITEELFNPKNRNLSELQKNSLKELIEKINEIKNEFIESIDNFTKQITTLLENINKNDNNNMDLLLKNGNNIKNDMNAIYNKYTNILNKYTKSQDFKPTNIKPYHDELFDGYKSIQIFVKELASVEKSRNNFVTGIENRFNKVKNIVINEINNIKSYKSNFKKFLKEIKL